MAFSRGDWHFIWQNHLLIFRFTFTEWQWRDFLNLCDNCRFRKSQDGWKWVFRLLNQCSSPLYLFLPLRHPLSVTVSRLYLQRNVQVFQGERLWKDLNPPTGCVLCSDWINNLRTESWAQGFRRNHRNTTRFTVKTQSLAEYIRLISSQNMSLDSI